MKKSLYLSAIVLMLVGTTLTGCSDFLEAEDKTNANQDADAFLNSNPTSLLMTAYNSLYNFAANIEMTDEGTDLYIPHRGKTASVFDQFTFDASTGENQNYYVQLYGTINYANGVLEKSSDNGEIAEATFLRSYCYYLLTQQFGAVPYVVKYIKSADRDYGRTDVAEIYEKCIEALDGVKANLPTVASHANLGAPTQEAANALIAKFYLAWGWDVDTDKGDNTTAAGQETIKKGEYTVNSTEHFQKAAEYADLAIANFTSSGLTMSFEDKWSPSNENNAEVFWAVQYDRASYNGSESAGGHSLQAGYGNYYGECTATGYKQSGSLHGQSLKSAYIFESGDARYDATFMTTMYNKTEKTPSSFASGGYFYYYNNPSSDASIGYMYFPAYKTTAEVTSQLRSMASRFAYDASTQNAPSAYIIGNKCTVFSFTDKGVLSSGEESFDELIKKVGGGVTVKKFDDKDTKVSASNDYRDIVIFHASDSYLDAAEAYLMANEKGKAKERLWAVRERSISDKSIADIEFESYSPDYLQVYTSFTIKDIDVILDERARETYAEQNRWVDLRRTNQLIRYNLEFNPNFSEKNSRNAKGEYKILRPIPATEVGNNTSEDMYQNPGY